ncbi:MAG: hypothetical protein Q9195_001629 [Heterodermia aff. obscurata]
MRSTHQAVVLLAALAAAPGLAQDMTVVTVTEVVQAAGPAMTQISTNVAYVPSTSTDSSTPVVTQAFSSVPTPATTPAPQGGSGGGGMGGGAQTFSIVNSYSIALSLAFDHNAGGPDVIGGPLSPTTIGAGSTTFYSFPTGWAGRIYVGKTTDPANSKIEGSITGTPDMDVSYVDGYSVPIVCTSAGKVSGCNTELFGLNGNKCGQNVDISDFQICKNPALTLNDGPADSFFAPCQGKAYTYPNDNDANYSNVDATTNCCIGTACSMGSSKRSVLSKRGAPPPHGHHLHQRRWNQPRSHVHRLVQDAKLKR